MKNTILIFLSVFVLAAMAYVGKEGYRAASAYEKASFELAKMMDAETAAEFQLKELAKTLTFGMVENDIGNKIGSLRAKQVAQQKSAQRLVSCFAILSTVILSMFLFVSPRIYTGIVSAGALIALVNGLVTPVLMVTVHKNIEYLGDVVFSFESKAILGSIFKLYSEGNALIALILLVFSVLIPVFKVFSLLFLSLYENYPFASRIVYFFRIIGKWSMLDIFVVALLIVYLSSSSTDVSRAEAEIGIYFFLVYVVLSIAASLSAGKMLQNK